MKKRANLWELDRLGQRYGQRPSAFLGLAGESWAAYQLDVATLALGTWVEGKLQERDRQGRPLYGLEALLDDAAPAGGGFRSAGQLGGVRKIRIPETGIW